MGLDFISALLIWGAILIQSKKKRESASSLDDFGITIIQAIAVASALIIAKTNPFIW